MKWLCPVSAILAMWSPSVVFGQGDAPAREASVEPILVVFHAVDAAPANVQVLRSELAAFAQEHAGAVVDVSPTPPAPPQAAEYLQRGQEAYRAFEYEQALGYLDQGLAEAERTGGDGLSASALADLHLARALVLSQLDQGQRAWDEMVAAATLDPVRVLDPVRFPPRVIESFARASAALRAGESSQFSVAVADGCQVFVDGRTATPGEARPVPLGPHYIRVACPGHEAYGARVQVQRAEQVHAPALRSLAPPDDASLRRLARTRGARSLLVARVIESPDAPRSASLRWLALDSERAHGSVTASLAREGDARQAVQTIERLLRRRAARDQVLRGRAARDRARPGNQPARPTAPWYRRPWVWAAAGAVATTLVLSPLLFDSPPPGGFTVRPSGDLP